MTHESVRKIVLTFMISLPIIYFFFNDVDSNYKFVTATGIHL